MSILGPLPGEVVAMHRLAAPPSSNSLRAPAIKLLFFGAFGIGILKVFSSPKEYEPEVDDDEPEFLELPPPPEEL